MKIKISVLIILAALILATMLAGCGSVNPVTRYARETRTYSFEYAMKHNSAFTAGALKEDAKSLSKKLAGLKKKKITQAGKNASEATLVELRKQILELENK